MQVRVTIGHFIVFACFLIRVWYEVCRRTSAAFHRPHLRGQKDDRFCFNRNLERYFTIFDADIGRAGTPTICSAALYRIIAALTRAYR